MKLLEQEDPVIARRDLRRVWRGRGSDRQRLVIGPPPVEIAVSGQDLLSLAGEEFAAGEARRMRRLLENAGALGSSSLLGPTLQVEAAPEDPAGAVRRLLDELVAGAGGTVEAVQLLSAIAAQELSDELRDEVVDVLLRRREAPDEAHLRNVAHELVRGDRKAAAADLYRLSVLAGGAGVPAYLRRNQAEKPGDVVHDVRERHGSNQHARRASSSAWW